MNVQKKLTDKILINDSNITKVGTSYIPIVIYECNRDRTEHKNVDIVMSEQELNKGVRSAITNAGYAEFPKLKWIQSAASSEEINNEFSKLLSASSKPSRVKDLALKLFQSNKYQTA